jgi:hypothetical protein
MNHEAPHRQFAVGFAEAIYLLFAVTLKTATGF